MEGELQNESIFCDAQLLTTHTLPAKGPTLNLVLIVSWPTLRPSWLGIFRIPVSVVSYKIFAMVVTCKEEEQRETIVDDQRNMVIGKAADLVESEYVCGELKTKTPSVSSLNFREIALRTKFIVSERLYAKSRDFKLMYEIDGNNYLEGTRCSENDLKSVRSRYILYFRVWRTIRKR